MQINGKELKITPGSLGEVFALKKAISDALREHGVKLDLSGIKFDDDLEVGDIGWIIEMVLGVTTSEAVRDCLFTLGRRASVGNDKITREYFDDPERWQHYYAIMLEIAKVNLSPFFKGLNFASLIPRDLIEKIPGLK